jgi:hypothetical protein
MKTTDNDRDLEATKIFVDDCGKFVADIPGFGHWGLPDNCRDRVLLNSELPEIEGITENNLAELINRKLDEYLDSPMTQKDFSRTIETIIPIDTGNDWICQNLYPDNVDIHYAVSIATGKTPTANDEKAILEELRAILKDAQEEVEQ